MASDGYLLGLLTDGARRFGYRPGVLQLLGLPVPTGVQLRLRAVPAAQFLPTVRPERPAVADLPRPWTGPSGEPPAPPSLDVPHPDLPQRDLPNGSGDGPGVSPPSVPRDPAPAPAGRSGPATAGVPPRAGGTPVALAGPLLPPDVVTQPGTIRQHSGRDQPDPADALAPPPAGAGPRFAGPAGHPIRAEVTVPGRTAPAPRARAGLPPAAAIPMVSGPPGGARSPAVAGDPAPTPGVPHRIRAAAPSPLFPSPPPRTALAANRREDPVRDVGPGTGPAISTGRPSSGWPERLTAPAIPDPGPAPGADLVTRPGHRADRSAARRPLAAPSTDPSRPADEPARPAPPPRAVPPRVITVPAPQGRAAFWERRRLSRVRLRSVR